MNLNRFISMLKKQVL